MHHVYKINDTPDFEKVGHRGYFFGTESTRANYLIVETDEGLTVQLTETECEFTYFVLEGTGTFVINGSKYGVQKDNLIVIPPNHSFTYQGKLKMLLFNTPQFRPEQEVINPIESK